METSVSTEKIQQEIVDRKTRRRQQREEVKKQREQQFYLSGKITREEFISLAREIVGLKAKIEEYKNFARNMFFVLEDKKMVSLEEMDATAKKRQEDIKIYHEIRDREDLPLQDKLALAKERGLSDVFIDVLTSEAIQEDAADNDK